VAILTQHIVNREAHWTVRGRIDERFTAPKLPDEGQRVVINLSEVTGISSLGVRALEETLRALMPRPVVLIHVAPSVAIQLNLVPALGALVKVESARLPFVCAICGAEKSQSVPWRHDAHRRFAPICHGEPMQLDGLPDHYLPTHSPH
jgi:hypothetical protein